MRPVVRVAAKKQGVNSTVALFFLIRRFDNSKRKACGLEFIMY